MKLPSFLAVSLMGNLLLAVIFMAARHGSAAAPGTVPSATAAPTARPTAPVSPPARGTPSPVVPWRQIASADYRQYIANLRAVECPDWLIRDIIVADIDDLYQQKFRADPVSFAPWQGMDQRRKISRSQSAKADSLRREKRTLVKSLLGYEWDNHADELWDWDLLTSLTLGFLPDDRAAQVVSLGRQYAGAAQSIREDANYILIDEDEAKLLALYKKSVADLAQQLDASQLDELQLRAQQRFLITHDIHFDGVAVSPGELRQIVRVSRPFQDMAAGEFLPDHRLSEAEQSRRRAAFDAQVKGILGLARFADYQRAQDCNFREIFNFGQQNHLPQTVAIKVYETRRDAAEQAGEIQKDATLSADERAAALGVLKAATADTIASALGGSYQNYLAESGQWLEALAQPPIQTP